MPKKKKVPAEKIQSKKPKKSKPKPSDKRKADGLAGFFGLAGRLKQRRAAANAGDFTLGNPTLEDMERRHVRRDD